MDAKVSFEKIQSGRLSDAAVEQIVDLISKGKIQVGDRLPSERDLVAQFGVSRASVREALRILEAQGILQVRAGKGTYVIAHEDQARPIPGMLRWLRRHQREVLETLEVREALERKAARLAAVRMTPEKLSSIRAVLVEMREHREHGRIAKATQANRDFHRQIAEASGNKLLVALLDHAVEFLSEQRITILAAPERTEDSIAEHTAILEAIEAADPDAAEAAVLTHLNSLKQAVRKVQNQEGAAGGQ